MRIHILALNGVFDTGLAAVLDAFDTANALAKRGGVSSLPFQMKVVGLRTTVTTAQGLSVPVTSATRAQTPDAVVMPAINRIMPEVLIKALANGEVREAGAVLRKWSGRGALTAAACVGTFVLAEAALLDGEEATTTWCGWHRCSGSAIRVCGSTSRGSSYSPTWSSPPVRRSAIWTWRSP
jgi:transcriptional regulator GlxA family with amidase domain